MVVGSELARLEGYRFEVRYSDGALVLAIVAAEVIADAYVYFSRLFSAVEPDIAVIVADEADWSGNGPYGLPFFNDDAGHACVRRDPAAGEPADARGASNRGSGKSKACRSDARRGLQHARGAASPLHGF